MRTLRNIMVLLMLTALTTTKASEGINFQHLTLDEAIAKAEKENKSIFVDIYATWCGPCKTLSRDVFPDLELGELMNANFINIKLDGELEDGEKLMRLFNLNSYPSMLIITPEIELQKKIVGLVDPETIIDGANAVLHPEATEIFQLEKRFNKGERGKVFMLDLIEESLLEDRDTEDLVTEYNTLFPELDLENEQEFLVFCLGSDDLEDSHVKLFLEDSKKLSDIHPELAPVKITNIIYKVVDDAVENDDESILGAKIDLFYDAYKFIFGEEAFSKTELLTLMTEMFNDN